MKSKLQYYIAILLMGLVCACNDDMPVSVIGENGDLVVDGEILEVPLDLTVSAQIPGSDLSRAIDDTGTDGENTKIHDLWVLQYRGTTTDPSSALMEYYYYIEDYSSKQTAKLVGSAGPSVIVILANTHAPNMTWTLNSTLTELQNKGGTVTSQSDLFVKTTADDDTKDYPEDNSYDMLLNYAADFAGGINNATEISGTLKRNVARIDVDVNVGTDVNLIIDGIGLYHVPNLYRFYTDRTLTATYPSGAKYVDFDAPTEQNLTADGKTLTAKFYTTPNYQGGSALARSARYSTSKEKPLEAPVNATYLVVKTHYTVGSDTYYRVFQFYVGADAQDYNVEPNHRYKYEINLNTDEIDIQDYRVHDYAPRDFTLDAVDELANCYILNPPMQKGVSRKFRIPVARVDEFWGSRNVYSEGYNVITVTPPTNSNYDDSGYKYENIQSNCLEKTNEWQVEVIWSDVNRTVENAAGVSPQFSITKSTGKGYRDYFEVEVPYGTEANVLVGLRRSPEQPILWSWHLWITSYDPDMAINYDAVNGNHPTMGGNVSYGTYGNYFHMDRLLSSLTSGFSAPHVFYQYGRKDPMPGGNLVIYDKEGNILSSKISKIASTHENLKDSNGNNIAMEYSIQNPNTFITGNGSWCNDNKYNLSVFDQQVVWFDPNVRRGNYYIQNKQKSIFDPSPLGWRLSPRTTTSRISGWSYCYKADGTWGSDNGYNRPHLQLYDYAYSQTHRYWEWYLTGGASAGEHYQTTGASVLCAQIR